MMELNLDERGLPLRGARYEFSYRLKKIDLFAVFARQHNIRCGTLNLKYFILGALDPQTFNIPAEQG